MPDSQHLPTVGAVVIGRNEGERLRLCLESIPAGVACVYVDSGSEDTSVSVAESLAMAVLHLDGGLFTAARARNAGFAHLRALPGPLDYVQFIDGDCELFPGWLPVAHAFLAENPEVAAVCGLLHERYPDRSLYNKLCEFEWEGPVGEIDACGGIVMMRADAFEAASGFREDLVAGEEPELCVRLRRRNWRIWRLDEEMATHDAAMTRFGQWWRRAVRGGHAAAEGAYLHGAAPEYHGVRQSRRAVAWGLALPLAGLAATAMLGISGVLVFLLYPLQVVRLARGGNRSASENWWRALFLVLGKFPEALGNLQFQLRRCFGGTPRLIEYK